MQTPSLRPNAVAADPGTPGLKCLEIILHLHAMMSSADIIAVCPLSVTCYWQATLAAGADEFVPKTRLVISLLPAFRRAAQVYKPEEGW